MLPKNFKKNIPSFRHRKIWNIFDNNITKKIFIKKKKFLLTKNLIQRQKLFYKTNFKQVNSNWFKFFSLVTKNYNYNIKPYALFIEAINIYNDVISLPGISTINPGKLIINTSFLDVFKKNIKFLGSVYQLDTIPYNLMICYLKNKQNNKWTFAKSSGSFCIRLKSLKKIKINTIQLPSTKLYYLPKTTFCYIGDCENFRVSTLVEGKWGLSLKKKKNINVRGVAMNPVDHPNGGRTKAKQPELSPWGWIAKNSH